MLFRRVFGNWTDLRCDDSIEIDFHYGPREDRDIVK
jgi:hypothetical protein